jgi:hypothetical protein
MHHQHWLGSSTEASSTHTLGSMRYCFYGFAGVHWMIARTMANGHMHNIKRLHAAVIFTQPTQIQTLYTHAHHSSSSSSSAAPQHGVLGAE